jgi:hypothetical protein
MSTYEKWSLITSAFGFLLVVGSLAILSHQTKLLAKAIDASASASVAERQINIDKVFVDKPELLRYFFGNTDISRDDESYYAALAVAGLLANYFDTYCLQKGMLKQMYSEPAWECYIKDYFRRSPLLREHVKEFHDWYTPDLLNLLRQLDGRP